MAPRPWRLTRLYLLVAQGPQWQGRLETCAHLLSGKRVDRWGPGPGGSLRAPEVSFERAEVGHQPLVGEGALIAFPHLPTLLAVDGGPLHTCSQASPSSEVV